MGDVLLTTDQVEAWKAERADLLAKVAVLDAKLNAAAVFMPDVKVSTANQRMEKADQPSASPSLGDAILAVLGKYGPDPLTNRGILGRLREVGFDASKMHKNYYYTATKRLADKGAIVKHEDGSYSLPSSATQARKYTGLFQDEAAEVSLAGTPSAASATATDERG